MLEAETSTSFHKSLNDSSLVISSTMLRSAEAEEEELDEEEELRSR